MTKEVFSFYRPPISSATIPVKSLDLDSIWEGITDHSLKESTDRLRDLLSQNNGEEYKRQKGLLLPSVTFGGVFDYRHTDPQKHRETLAKKLEEETDPDKISKIQKTIGLLEGKTGLQSSSGLVIIDIDHISQTGLSLEELRDRLSADPEIGVRLIFVSPSGDGLKVVCKTSAEITDPQSYKSVFESLRYYINTTYGEIVDKSGSDVSRLCLLCYDPSAVIKDPEEYFNPDLHKVPEKNIQRPQIYQNTDYWGEEDGIEEIVRRVESSGMDIAIGYNEYLSLGFMFANEIGGDRGLSLYKRVCRGHINRNGKPITDQEIEDQFERCKGGYGDKGTLINLCKSMGIDVSNPVERPQTERVSRKQTSTPTSTKEETPVQTEEEIQKEREEKYKDYLQIPEISQIVSTKREGIKTRYKFGETKGKEEYLTLRSGAMTLICGKSSHGKSKLLQNLSLQIATDLANRGEDGSVLFFTYEEELSDVLLQFANIWVNMTGLSRYGTPNTEIFKDYYREGSLSRCTSLHKPDLSRKLGSFNDFYKSGKLRIFYEDKSSQSLCELIHYLSEKIKIKAVFVDYVQLLYRDYTKKGERRPERREEIKEICNDLRKTAIDLGLPIVLSAQLNRETPNPTEMSEDNIADSADLTRYANTILCLWNSSFDNVKGGKSNYLQTEDGKRLGSRGFKLGEGGQIFAKITKNRGGTPNIDTILDFVGETGSIPTPEDEREEEYKSTIPGLEDDLPEGDFQTL